MIERQIKFVGLKWRGNRRAALLILFILATVPSITNADENYKKNERKSVQTEINCADPSIDFANDPSLTPAEKVALMDAALMHSLNKFDACQTSQSSASSGGGGAAGGDGNAGDGEGAGSDGLTSDAGGSNSVASSDMSGTEKSVPGNEQLSAGVSGWTSPSANDSETQIGSENGTEDLALKNGIVPADIPPADNDSVLEAQIRKAAINDKDP